MAAVLLAALLMIALSLGWASLPSLFEQIFAPASAGQLGSDVEQSAQPLSNTQHNPVALPVAESNSTGFLQLVNYEHPLDTELPQALLQPVYPVVDAVDESILLQATTLESIAGLSAAARQAGVGSLVVNSGYRSYSEQAQLYEAALDKSYVQQPGMSEHHTGLACDIELGMTGEEAGATSALLPMGQNAQIEQTTAWVAEHAWEYGLIVRYPEDKQLITQIAYEPWHVRYVGLPHAWYCFKYQLCLEEYLEMLSETGGYEVRLDGITYAVFYQTAQDGVVYVPESQNYEVSHDGSGGYVVTTWE